MDREVVEVAAGPAHRQVAERPARTGDDVLEGAEGRAVLHARGGGGLVEGGDVEGLAGVRAELLHVDVRHPSRGHQEHRAGRVAAPLGAFEGVDGEAHEPVGRRLQHDLHLA